MDKRPRSVVSPSGLRPFLAVSQNAFRPGDPRNGPELRFFFSDPTIIWEKGNLGALGSAIIRIDGKPARYSPFFADNQFSPADEAVLMGLVVRKCHFDVTACAEARWIMPIGQFKKMWSCSDATWWPTLEPMQVAPPDDHILNQCKLWWSNLQLMQVVSSSGQICNQCK